MERSILRVMASALTTSVGAACRRASTAASALARPASLEVFNMHRSNAQELVARVPVIEVAARVAMCDGGGASTGHPIEFIKLDRRDGPSANACKYCGLRFKMAPGHHH